MLAMRPAAAAAAMQARCCWGTFRAGQAVRKCAAMLISDTNSGVHSGRSGTVIWLPARAAFCDLDEILTATPSVLTGPMQQGDVETPNVESDQAALIGGRRPGQVL